MGDACFRRGAQSAFRSAYARVRRAHPGLSARDGIRRGGSDTAAVGGGPPRLRTGDRRGQGRRVGAAEGTPVSAGLAPLGGGKPEGASVSVEPDTPGAGTHTVSLEVRVPLGHALGHGTRGGAWTPCASMRR